jgi:hypothetical protein
MTALIEIARAPMFRERREYRLPVRPPIASRHESDELQQL